MGTSKIAASSFLSLFVALWTLLVPTASSFAQEERPVDPSAAAPITPFEKLPIDPRAVLDSGFDRVLRVTESDGSTLEAEGDRLYRTRAESRLLVASTTETGVIHNLAPDPIGATFIGADNGIFLISPDVETMAPIPLRDGVPAGVPLALCLDARRRLWVATENEFGCVSTSQFFGRTIETPDWGRPRQIVAEPTGAIRILTERGFFRYVPDQGTAPTVEIHKSDGTPATSGEVVSLPFRAGFEVALSGSGSGGATYRYRWDDQFPWRQVTGSSIQARGLAPGHRRLQVIAIDRDLNTSPPATLYADVQWPLYWRPSVVLALGLATALGLAGIRFWPRRGDAAARQRAFVSAFVALFLGLQILAAAIPHARGWPIVGYSMYTGQFSRDEVAIQVVIEGIAPDGSRHRIDVKETGLEYLTGHIARPLITEGDAAGKALVERLNERRPDRPLRGVEVRMYRWQLSRQGPVALAPFTLSRYEE